MMMRFHRKHDIRHLSRRAGTVWWRTRLDYNHNMAQLLAPTSNCDQQRKQQLQNQHQQEH